MSAAPWSNLLQELSRDAAQAQPQDAVQWGADWFQNRLKREREAGGNSQRGPSGLGALPPSTQTHLGAPHALSPFSETGPHDSPFSNSRRSTEPSGSSGASGAGTIFANSFGGGAPPREPSPFAPDEAGPTDTSRGIGGGAAGGSSMFGNASPFGQPAVQGADADEPPIPSYALGRRTSVSAESLVPQAQRSLAPALDSTTEEDEEGEGSGQAQNAIPNFPKTEAQLARIRAAIKPNFLFRNLDEEQEADVLAAMKEVQIGAGEMIIEQGAAGDYFYVVEKGELEVFVKKEGQMIDTDKGDRQLLGKKVATCVEGNSFGELALMHNAPRAASIVSVSPSTLWALDRVSFRTILLDHTSRKRRLYESFLSEVPILASLQPQERAKIADVLESRTFTEGTDVIKQGDAGDEFYLVEAGSAVAVKSQDGQETVVKTYNKGDYFGELALLNRQTRAATVRASGSEPLRVAALGEQAFTRLLGPVKDIMARNVGERYGFAVGR